MKQFVLRLCQRLRISEGEFAIVFTNDRGIRHLNLLFRNWDRATDVLSFPGEPKPKGPNFENNYLGDIIISVETAQRQAFDKHHSLETELRVLIVHGLLHLLGYDHETDQGQMRRRELKLQRELL
jgi:probable rRNA maturation factor